MVETVSQDLEKRLARVITHHQLIVDKMQVIVGVSAGPDSLALLLLLHALPLKLDITAVYVDHQLRPAETEREYATVVEIGRKLNLNTVREVVDVPGFRDKYGGSLEDVARKLRYRALKKVCSLQQADRIAVGHTADDQVEEFFLRILRGSGAKGLSGMKLRNGIVLRPLLHERKETLLQYLQEKNVVWCVDSSNLDKDLLRNRIRLDLLPMLERHFNPSLRTTVLQSMDILREEDDYLENLCQKLFAAMMTQRIPDEQQLTPDLSGAIDRFRSLAEPLRRRLIEKCCWHLGTKPSFVQILKVSNFVIRGENGKELHLSQGLRVCIRNDRLIFLRPLPLGEIRGRVPSAQTINLEIEGPGIYRPDGQNKELRIVEVTWPQDHVQQERDLFIDRDRVAFPLRLRSALPGERFYPHGHSGSRKVFRYFNDRKIPRHTRSGWPVLLTADAIIALPGLAIDTNYRCTPKTTRALLIEWT